MVMTVKENFTIFGLFVCLFDCLFVLMLYAQVNGYCHVGLLTSYYANFSNIGMP